MTIPKNGPINDRWGPYIKNAQPIEGTPLFLADACRGITGRARNWYPILLAPNPQVGKEQWPNGPLVGPWQPIGLVKKATSYYRLGLLKAVLYKRKDPVSEKYCYVEAFMPETEALNFLIHAAKEYWK